MASRPRQSPEQSKTDRILAAADELFGERGYDAVSVRDIARAAGVNKPLIFYYFSSKEELFGRILTRYYDAHRRALQEALSQPGAVDARLTRLVDAYFDFMADNRRFARLVQQQLAGPGTHLELIQANLTELERWTEQALEHIAPSSGPLAARHFFVTLSGAMINYFTYSAALRPAWGGDPLADAALAERRAHLHWLVEVVVSALRAER
ncbi:MAG TPA: TetR/AcrR family transcriptional regulator [Polyangiaceae bacterium]|nr:TetR/AcrR family transcriptional regulator [Polyangiaceae bacterium]